MRKNRNEVGEVNEKMAATLLFLTKKSRDNTRGFDMRERTKPNKGYDRNSFKRGF